MAEELINFDLPKEKSSIIKVIGVGGGGGNAVNHMCRQGIKDVDFVVCNTDAQALAKSPVSVKIQLGESLTEGRGAGNKPEVGRAAAIENITDVQEVLSHNTKMVFITAGMGGGTGTGAAPVIAKAAKEMNVLTVAIVTIPFRFEGAQRINQAIEGINEIKEHVDSLLIINNEKLREIYGDLKLSEAFSRADNVLASAAKGIAEIITVPGYVNVDFADVYTVMNNSGVALMGSATAEGEDRAIKAIEEALSSPLLNNNDITGAQNILLNITSGNNEVSMDEIGEITDYVNNAVSKSVLLIWGTCADESLGDKISVTVIATGFEASSIPELYIKKKNKAKVSLQEKFEKSITTPPTTENPEGFKVKDKNAPKDDIIDEETIKKDRVVEFEMDDDQDDEQLLLFDVKSMGDNKKPEPIKQTTPVSNTRKSPTYLKEKGYNVIDDNQNIEELENEPAYLRKKVELKQKESNSESNEVSRYSLEEGEGDRFARLNSDNSYLHDTVD